MDPPGDDPGRVLTPAGQWTEPWGSRDDGDRCDKCDGSGHTPYECLSCALTWPDDSCPACSGAVRWDEKCPVCRGSGRIDADPRHGVSVFPKVEGLYGYMIARETEIADCVVVELEASLSDDIDFDADQGALLAVPTAINRCHPTDRLLVERVTGLLRRRAAERTEDAR